MGFEFTDQQQNVTLETNQTGELIFKMSDGSNTFSDIVSELFQESYDISDMSTWDLSSAEKVNELLQIMDLSSQVAGFLLKTWRMGALALLFNDRTDLLNLPMSRYTRAILLEAKGGGLSYDGMKALLADEISFETIQAKRRGEEASGLNVGARILAEVRMLLEHDFLLPKSLT